MITKYFFAIFYFFLTSCTTNFFSISSKDDLNIIIEDSYIAYSGLNADGTDINAMLSYCTLSISTNNITTFKECEEIVNRYLQMAETEYISPNYSYIAGSNEVLIVSNFFFRTISHFEASGTKVSSVPEQIFELSQHLVNKIHKSEFEKK